jgi:hypothetical protein
VGFALHTAVVVVARTVDAQNVLKGVLCFVKHTEVACDAPIVVAPIVLVGAVTSAENMAVVNVVRMMGAQRAQ